MKFEKLPMDKENLTKYENRIKEIKEKLASQGYNKELDEEFLEMWRALPNGVSNETHENIDEIRNLLMDGFSEQEMSN